MATEKIVILTISMIESAIEGIAATIQINIELVKYIIDSPLENPL